MSFEQIQPTPVDDFDFITAFVWKDAQGVKHNDAAYYHEGYIYLQRDGKDSEERMTVEMWLGYYENQPKRNQLNQTILDFIKGRGL